MTARNGQPDLSRAGIFEQAEISRQPPTHRAVPAVTRAIAVLRLLSGSKTPLGVLAIASQLNIIPSTCLHILRVLVLEELVSFDPSTKLYALDAGVLNLARSLLRPDSFGNLIQPALDELADNYPITALAARILNDEHMIVIATSGAEHVMRIRVEPGSRFPTFMSATGRCVAAFAHFKPEIVKKRFHSLRWERTPSFQDWLNEVGQTRRQGYGIDQGAYVAGLTVVATPIMQQSNVLSHVLVAIGLSEQLPPPTLKRIIQASKALTSRYSHKEQQGWPANL